jgi:hypothetical protein
MKIALKYSPLCLAVYAWDERGGLYVKSGSDNHWTTKFAQPSISRIFDSYDPYIKNVDQSIFYCKRFHIERNTVPQQITLIQKILNLMYSLLGLLKAQEVPIPIPAVVMPPIAPQPQPAPIPSPVYLWDTPINARHSVRVIADKEKLTVEQKNTMCATIGAESGWKPQAVGQPNTNGTRDWGIVQINDAIWIGIGKRFPSTDYVLNNPEDCVRWMCGLWKAGKRSYWVAYSNGSYTKYLS